MRLVNGIKKLASDSNENGGNGEGRENDRRTRKQSFRSKLASGKQQPSTNGSQEQINNSTRANGGGDASKANGQDSVFKSANWLSDSELIFSLTNQVGGLVRALRVFQELDIGIKHVESRPSKRRDSEFEIFVDIDCSDKDKMRKLVHHLR